MLDVELSNPNTFVQSLLKLGSFLHGKTIESFDNPKNYPPITLPPLQTPVEIEEHRKNTTLGKALHKTLKLMKSILLLL